MADTSFLRQTLAAQKRILLSYDRKRTCLYKDPEISTRGPTGLK